MRNVSLIVGILVWGTLSAFAEVKPPGTLLETFCGDNEGASTEINRAITEVCLARVEGLKNDFVVLRQVNGSNKALADLVLPVLERRKPGVVAAPAGVKRENLVLGLNGTQEKKGYPIYQTMELTLTSKIAKTSTKPVYRPTSLHGKDLGGEEIIVRKLNVVFHTESLP